MSNDQLAELTALLFMVCLSGVLLWHVVFNQDDDDELP